MTTDRRPHVHGIAIVGAAVRVPGAATPGAFFDLLLGATSVSRPVPESRVSLAGRAGLAPPSRVRAGGFLDDIESFDPEFFGLPENDARYMDPQQRLFLDVAWEAIERAGYRPDRLADKRAGVFVGMASNDYTQWAGRAGLALDVARIPGSLNSFAAGRVAYCLDLTGPALAIDAACASSLYAVHLAVQSLRAGETRLAIAGGVNVLLLTETTELFDAAGLLSDDGQCRAYEDTGTGYFRSEGAVALFLKPLEDALDDEDDILGVIRGTAVVQDGRSRAGIVAPSVTGQTRAARAALEDAGVDPATIDLVEGQGTGTRIGDGMEVKALAQVFGGRRGTCALGSTKRRLGHLEAAAGAAGLLSAALALKHGIAPPGGDVAVPDRAIEFESTPFYLADRPRDLPADRPRRAAVHGYGMGGLNVHVVLESAPPAAATPSVDGERPELFTLSARTMASLRADMDAVLHALAAGGPATLADWCRAAATRKPRAVRLAIVARSLDQLADRLHLALLAPDRPSLRASGIFVSTESGEPALIDDVTALSPSQQSAIRRATTGRWSERRLHPHLAAGPHADVRDEERAAWLEALARAFAAGADLEPAALFARGRRAPLPPAHRANRPIWPESAGAGARRTREQQPAIVAEPSIAPIELPTLTAAAPSTPPIAEPPVSTASTALEALVWHLLERASMRPLGPCDPDASFLDAGVDSLALARLATLLEEGLGVALPAGAVFERPTAGALASWLEARQVDHDQLKARVDAPAPVNAIDRCESFSLTPLQQAYYAASQVPGALGGRSCQVLVDLEIDAALDEARLRASLERLVERHPMLGVTFTPDGVQHYAGDRVRATELRVESLRGLATAARTERLTAIKHDLLATAADLARGPMLRAVAVDLAGAFRLILTVDLIVADLESVRILVADWRALYEAPEQPLEVLSLTFDQYRRIVDERTPPERKARDRQYWMERADRLPGPPALPLTREPAALPAAHFLSKSYILPIELRDRLRARASLERVTASALLGGAFAGTLARFGGGEPFCLNLPVFDRRPVHDDVARMVGPFSTNIIVSLSARADDDAGCAREFEAAVRAGLEHRTFSGVELARAVASRRRHTAPIAPVVFTAPLYGRRFEAWGSVRDVRSQTPHVWLDCQAVETVAGLLLRWDYVEELFHPETIAAMFRDFVDAVRTLAEAPNPDLDGPGVRLRHALAVQGAVEAPTLDAIVACQAERSPHLRAALAGHDALTYGALDQAANRVANSLAQAGVKPGDRVAIACARGIEQIAMVAGVLRAGAAYVPIDPGQPDARAAEILESARPAAVLVDPQARSRPFVGGSRYLGIAEALAGSDRPVAPSSTGDSLAYVIFTSGSTGRPKGVMIQHKAALNTIVDINRRFALGPLDRLLAFSSLGFDLSVWDLFGAFAAGASIVVLPDEDVKAPSAWLELIQETGVTVWSSVPTGMSMLVDFFEGRMRPVAPTLRLVMLSGDWIPVSLPDRVRALFDGVEVVSLGGATEASIWSCIYRIGTVDAHWTSIPYGRALSGQRFHVLDDRMAPVADCEAGELYIGGVGVALGYLGDEARTRERFVDGPPGLGRLYRTGDRGRWMPSGEMEFLGRQDLQVKIRGFRVELAEIEAALRAHPGLADCVVSVRGDRNDRELVAHYVAPAAISTGDLLEHLRSKLPDYMVPRHFVKHGALPLNVNGKVDRLQLS